MRIYCCYNHKLKLVKFLDLNNRPQFYVYIYTFDLNLVKFLFTYDEVRNNYISDIIFCYKKYTSKIVNSGNVQ